MFREKCVNFGQFICTQEREFNIHKIKVPEEDNMNSGREQTFKDNQNLTMAVTEKECINF